MGDTETKKVERNGSGGEKNDLMSKIATLVVGLAVGGGAGSGITSQSVSSELRETRAVIVGRIERIENKVDDAIARAGDHEKRIRELELERAARGAHPPR